jgi:hypothetical protein
MYHNLLPWMIDIKYTLNAFAYLSEYGQRPLSIMHNIPLLTNSTLLTGDMILLCIKKPVPNQSFSFPFCRKICIQSRCQILYPYSMAYVVYPNSLSKSKAHAKDVHVYFLWWGGSYPHAKPPSQRTAPLRLSAVAYSMYSQLSSIAGGRFIHPHPDKASCWGDKGPTTVKSKGADWQERK